MDAPRTTLILLRGLPGAGKTTLAEGLCKRLRCPLLAKDDVCDLLKDYDNSINASLAASPSQQQPIASGANDLSYDVMLKILRTQIMCGVPYIVCDSPLGKRDLFDRICDVADEHNASVIVIDCFIDDGVWRERIGQRSNDIAHRHKPVDVDAILQYYKCEPNAHLRSIVFPIDDRANFVLRMDLSSYAETALDDIVQKLLPA